MDRILDLIAPSASNLRTSQAVFATLNRFVFASTLLLFFWASALTKFDGPFSLSINAYAQIFPKSFEAVGYDASQMSWIHTLIAYAGGYSEIILPLFVVLGLATRLSAIGMIGFIAVLTVVDIYGHGVTTGRLFDKDPYGIIADQRLFWVLGLAWLATVGGGYLSLDELLRKMKNVPDNSQTRSSVSEF